MTTVNLISLTPNAEDQIAYLARVSNPNAKPGDPSDRLIRYLIKHGHWSPLEMCHMVVEIHTTRAISAQILRHRSFSFQEFSMRYSDVSGVGFASPPNLRRQDHKNRQSSHDDLPEDVKARFNDRILALYDEAQQLYHDLLDADVAKECAREVLPLGTPTKLYMSGTIRSWIHYVKLRGANGTQKEHRDVAVAVGEILRQEMPNVYQAAFTIAD